MLQVWEQIGLRIVEGLSSPVGLIDLLIVQLRSTDDGSEEQFHTFVTLYKKTSSSHVRLAHASNLSTIEG